MDSFTRITSVIGKLLGHPVKVDTPTWRPASRPREPRPYSGPRYPIPGLDWTAEYIASKAFLRTWEWRSLAYDTIKTRGRRCEMCGRTPHKHGVAINVDHIKSRRDRPDLALSSCNLQILCDDHNHGKGNRHSDDWRDGKARGTA